MKKPIITLSTVENQINNMKDRKSAGSGLLMVSRQKFIKPGITEVSGNCLNNASESGNIPDTWKISNTTLIEKKQNPIITDLRPIALTNIC